MKKIAAAFAIILASVGVGLSQPSTVSADYISGCYTSHPSGTWGMSHCTVVHNSEPNIYFRTRLTCKYINSGAISYVNGLSRSTTGYSSAQCSSAARIIAINTIIWW